MRTLIARAAAGAGESRRGGFILVAVLWIVAALAGLVGMFAVYASVTTRQSADYVDKIAIEQAIYSAIEMTAFELQGTNAGAAEPQGAFVFQLGAYATSVRYTSEAARLDLNLATREQLAEMLVTAGSKPADADYIADRIVGWRTGNGVQAQTEEAQIYASAGLPYGPRQAPFQNVAELWSVLGVPAQLAAEAMPYVTVYGTRPGVDRRGGAPPGGEAGGARNTNSVFDTPPARANAPRTLRLDIVVNRAGAPVSGAEVVIHIRPGEEEPYFVLSWR